MSDCRWCDIGQHPFPAGQPGATTLKAEQYVKNQWGGSQPMDVVEEVCAACARDSGIKKMSDARGNMAEAEADALADAIRDGSAGRSFRDMLGGKKAVTAGNQSNKYTERDRGTVEKFLEWQLDNPDGDIADFYKSGRK